MFKIRMATKLKHYIEYLYPGIFLSNSSVSEIPERDVSKVSIPDDCCGFRFFDRTETVLDGEILIGHRKNISGWYYKGEKMTIEQVKATYGYDHNYSILISNMECNDVGAVVKTKFGNFMPLHDEDEVI